MTLNRGSNLLFRQSNYETAATKMSTESSNGTMSHFAKTMRANGSPRRRPYQGNQRPATFNYPSRWQPAQAGGGGRGDRRCEIAPTRRHL